MPGLLRAMGRTAVIAGTASATANAVNRRQMKKNVAAYEQAQAQYAQQQAAPQPAAPMPAQPGVDDKIAQLERLAQLKAQGRRSSPSRRRRSWAETTCQRLGGRLRDSSRNRASSPIVRTRALGVCGRTRPDIDE